MRIAGNLLAGVALLSVAVTASAQTTHQVTQIGLSFSPDDITIDCGDTIEWVWTGFGTHTATEGTDAIVDPTDAFHLTFDDVVTSVSFEFDTKFLFENPRPGNVYPYVCVPHFAFGMVASLTVNCPWSDLGFAKGGALGDPLLYGNGPLTSGSASEIVLENAPPSSLAVLFIGLNQGNAPFKDGTLVPVPILLQINLFSNPAGGVTLPFVVPAGLAGFPIYFQYGLDDATATKGVGLSNAIEAAFQ